MKILHVIYSGLMGSWGINVQLDRKNKQKIFWIELNEIVQITHDKLGLVEDKDKR